MSLFQRANTRASFHIHACVNYRWIPLYGRKKKLKLNTESSDNCNFFRICATIVDSSC